MLVKWRLEKIMIHLLSSIQTSVPEIQVFLHKFMGNTANLHFQEWHNGSALLKSLCRARRYANWSIVHCVIAPCVLGILMGNQNRPFIMDCRLRINHLFNNWRLKQILPVRLYWCSRVLILPHAAMLNNNTNLLMFQSVSWFTFTLIYQTDVFTDYTNG